MEKPQLTTNTQIEAQTDKSEVTTTSSDRSSLALGFGEDFQQPWLPSPAKPEYRLRGELPAVRVKKCEEQTIFSTGG